MSTGNHPDLPGVGPGVIVFLRCPKPGQVKTRLAKTVGDERACAIYEACAEGVLRGVLGLVKGLEAARLYVFFSVVEEAAEVEAWVRRRVGDSDGWITYCPQKQTACLGARMVDAFSFVEGQGHDRIGILGTDVPDLADEGVLKAGLRVLEVTTGTDGGGEGGGRHVPRRAAVLGPSEDGGFYMLLMSGVGGGFFGSHSDLFQDIVWSTETVLEDTSEALKRAGFEVSMDGVPRLRDLDEWEDVRVWVDAQKGAGGNHRQARLLEVARM